MPIILSLTLMFSSIGTSLVKAESLPKSNNGNALVSTTTSQLTTEDISKMDKYVILDSKNKKYILSEDAKKSLNKTDLDKLKDALKNANNEIKKMNQYNETIDVSEKTFKVTGSAPTNDNGGISTFSISQWDYWNWELHWWGKRIYFSNRFINDMKNYVRTYTAAGGVASAGVAAFIVMYCGASGPIGDIFGALTAYQFAYFYDKLVNTNVGLGVYADAFMWESLLPTNFKYYRATFPGGVLV